mgnify:CR=1 FL=1
MRGRLIAGATFALLWVALAGTIDPSTAALGLAVGLLVAALLDVRAGRVPGASQILRWVRFAAWYVWQMLRSNVRLAVLVLSPTRRLQSAVLAVPVELESNLELTVLSNLVTFAPGSMMIDVSDDRRTLYVHVVGPDDPERRRAGLAEMARRTTRLLR